MGGQLPPPIGVPGVTCIACQIVRTSLAGVSYVQEDVIIKSIFVILMTCCMDFKNTDDLRNMLTRSSKKTHILVAQKELNGI